mmetsp:Transcript_55508/g.119425  ORF Transcript_55508/g.119425 Transcript_55508/m.119425 type:complete len:210 (+) Transcript_55508:771-1400(+)
MPAELLLQAPASPLKELLIRKPLALLAVKGLGQVLDLWHYIALQALYLLLKDLQVIPMALREESLEALDLGLQPLVGTIHVLSVLVHVDLELALLLVHHSRQGRDGRVLPRLQCRNFLPHGANVVDEGRRLLPDQLQLRLVKLHLLHIEGLDLALPRGLATPLFGPILAPEQPEYSRGRSELSHRSGRRKRARTPIRVQRDARRCSATT